MASSLSLDVAAGPARSHVISVKLRDINQLFNSMDTSPFIEKISMIRRKSSLWAGRGSSRPARV